MIETVTPISARVIVNMASLKLRKTEIETLVDTIKKAVDASHD